VVKDTYPISVRQCTMRTDSYHLITSSDFDGVIYQTL